MAQTLSPPRPTLDDPEPASRQPADGPRGAGIRDALITLLVCLGVWALLLSAVLERSAETGPVGARRAAALAVLRPLSSLSDALAISRLSEGVARALGHDPAAPVGGELELPDLDLPPLPSPEPRPRSAPPSPAPAPVDEGSPVDRADGREPAEEPEVAGIRVPTEEALLRVVIVGDSLAQGLGPAMAGWFDADLSRVFPLGRQSTGLARRDYFNWQGAMRQIEEELRPDLVFVMLGSNDNQAQVTAGGDDVPVGSFAWGQAYRDRAAAFLREATSHGTHVVWVGIPVVRDHQRWDFYRRVNGIYAETARADPLATYVDAWELFQARDGGYAAYLRNEHGVLQEMRAGDGLHLTPTGYAYLARNAIRAAAAAFDLPQRSVTFPI